MKQIFLILMLLLFLAEARSQSAPWVVQPTASNHTIFIKSTSAPSVEGEPLESGDVIGVFYDSLGKQACAGVQQWRNENSFIVVYGNDGSNPGFMPGELFQYKVWRKNSGCIIDKVEVVYSTGGGATHSDKFAENGLSELASLQGFNELKIENFKIQLTHATCIAGGKMKLTGEISAPYLIELIDLNSSNKLQTDDSVITEIPEGDYQLNIYKNNCVLEWKETLSVLKDPNCQYPIITPNQDGIDEDFYIPYNGTAKIYDRNGSLKKQIPIPGTWDCTDSIGNTVPMGTYIIICEQKEIMVTVIK